MSEFRIQYDNRDLTLVLERLILRNTKLKPLFREISDALVISTQARFESQTTPDNIAWDVLKPATLARKEKRGRPPNKLKQDLNLVYSLRADFSETFGGVSVGGAGVPYAAIHQFGGTPGMAPGPAAIPARTYLGISASDTAEIVAIALAYERNAILGI